MKSMTVQKIRGQIARYEYKLDLFKNLPKYEKPQEYLKIWDNFEKIIQIVQKNPNSSQYSEIEVKHGEKVKRLNKKNLH